jgi:hypothetical protein
MNRWALTVFLIATNLLITSNPCAAQTGGAAKELDGFATTRSEVLSLISGSTNRIRIVSDFLSDGEIVSALYIAQYRKVDVKVLLGVTKASHVLSRLSYLKNQNIQVWLRPRGFYAEHPTLILADDSLYSLNAELDYMARHRRFMLIQLPNDLASRFAQAFDQASTSSLVPEARPMPLVGKPSRGGHKVSSYSNPSSSDGSGRPAQTRAAGEPEDGSHDTNGVYRYSRKKHNPGSGIPTKLPKETIMQNKADQGR